MIEESQDVIVEIDEPPGTSSPWDDWKWQFRNSIKKTMHTLY